ncbi:MAG: S49 family peptidase [Candidatus Nanohaloarchaea archaeon]
MEKLKRKLGLYCFMRKYLVILAAVIMVSVAAGLSFEGIFTQQQTGTVALIELSGTISPSSSGFSSGMTPEYIRDLNEEAMKRNVDAVVYEINSGGGAVVASKDVRRSIESVDVPTVCRIRDVGASGAYLFSLGCDSIVADSASITGSIGVTSSYIEFSDLMDEIGVGYVNITAGENKEVGSPYKKPTDEEKQILKEKADIIKEEFLGEVSEERNLTNQQEEIIGTGEIFLGSEAKELNLVDKLGGRSAAIEEAGNLTDRELRPVEIQKEPSFSLLSLFMPGLDIGGKSPISASLN